MQLNDYTRQNERQNDINKRYPSTPNTDKEEWEVHSRIRYDVSTWDILTALYETVKPTAANSHTKPKIPSFHLPKKVLNPSMEKYRSITDRLRCLEVTKLDVIQSKTIRSITGEYIKY